LEKTEREKLVARAAQGDRDALQCLIVRHHASLRREVARGIGPAVQRYLDAEDVLQDAYVLAFRNARAADLQSGEHFFRWLRTIARNQLKSRLRALRQKKRDIAREQPLPGADRTPYPALVEQLTGSDTTPSRRLARAEATAAMLTSLARLTDEQRSAIRMRFLEGRPVAEIAGRLGKSESAVYMLFHRGLKALRDSLTFISRYSLSG